jgi:hypothetical protein
MSHCREAARRAVAAACCAALSAAAGACATSERLDSGPADGSDRGGEVDATSSGGGGVQDGGGGAPGTSSDGAAAPVFNLDAARSADGCMPIPCASASGTYCGVIGDGCHGTLACGDCPNGGVCGGGGIDHVCAPAGCAKGACTADSGAVYCGVIGDGCGGVLDCGAACPDGGVCGGGGTPGVCPGTGSGVCTGIQCNVATCPNGSTTSLSGIVYDPAGANPLYDALVYVPNGPLDPVPTGASCDLCSATASGHPIASALSDTAGHFQLANVPTGTNIPLVIQVGKWRRQVTIANVASCVDNPITDPNLTRLPRSQSEGNIPRIALTTGGSDALECLLRRIGVADSEFTTDSGNGRVQLYYGGDLTSPTSGNGVGTSSFSAGGTFSSAGALWSNVLKMTSYDLLMLSCEGGQYASAKLPYLPNMEAYLNAGGRVFFDHLHFYWLNHGSAALKGTADYIGVGSDLPMPVDGIVNTTFPKGNAMADWLVNVGATPTRTQLAIYQGQYSVDAVNAPTQAWITVPVNTNDSKMRPSVQYMTFNTPVGAAESAQCGRAVFTDLHMNVSVNGAGGDNSTPTKPFPTECKTNAMTPQAKALEFMFFDLSACVQPDNATPVAPPPPPLVPPPPLPPMPPPAQ